MLRKLIAFTFIFLGISSVGFAQFYPTQYRPPNQNWQYLTTPHFNLVYSEANDSVALKMGQFLEQQYPKIQNLVGGELKNFPIILNDYNDRSNGFVTPLHFRSEIELPPIKGKSLNPQTGTWLQNVGPHELVHALQFSNLGDYNIPRLVSLFSPDLARAFHGAIPSGIIEGIAVQHETEGISTGGGRGQYPFFTNQFSATFKSDRRWSMGQLAHTSTDTRPFGRHYIGGYAFTSWLHEQFGDEITRNALDFYMDFPFLGYGIALKHATGLWPNQLYNRFEDHQEQRLQDKSANTTTIELDIPFKGREIRRPQWLSDSTLIFYGSFYNARSGFYRYNLNSKKLDRLVTTNSVSDYQYDVSGDRSEVIFSYYETDPIYDNTAKAELVLFDLDTHQQKQLTDNGRLYAPAFLGDSLLALHTEPASSQLVSFTKDDPSEISEISSSQAHEIKSVAVHPNTDQLAVVSNNSGQQSLWITTRQAVSKDMDSIPRISFSGGSIFDPGWHPKENKLLFSSDFSGTLQLYEYDLDQKEIYQLTDAPFNAFEGSYSPSGDRIAYVQQVTNERLPVVQKRDKLLYKNIEQELWQPRSFLPEKPAATVSDSILTASETWGSGSYSTGLDWLKPRTLLPVLEEVSNRNVYRWGVGLHSNSLLANQSYSASVSIAENRGWYNLTYQNKMFYPGFKARIFSRPSYVSIPNQDRSEIFTLLRQERSAALSIPFQYKFTQNIYNTSLFIEPEFRQSQIRFFDISNANQPSDFANISISNIYAQFNYRLQQNIRDVQPNSGAIIFAELEHYLSTDNLDFSSASRTFEFQFQEPTALRGGIYSYLSPLRRWNQSLRIGLQGITQSGFIFDNQSIISRGFSEPLFPSSDNLLRFSTRYTIPLTFVDNGGFLLPLYLNNLYLVAFSDTVVDPTLSNWHDQSRSVFGVELRSRFRVSNLSFDIGIGYGFEPSRGNHKFYISDF